MILYVESKKPNAQNQGAKWQLAAQGGGGNVEILSKVSKFVVMQENKVTDPMYNITTIDNNKVVNAGNLLRPWIRGAPHHTHKDW